MNIPGENANGVLSSNEYLTRVNLMGLITSFRIRRSTGEKM